MEKVSFYESCTDRFNYYRLFKCKDNKNNSHFHKNIEIAFMISGKSKITINGKSRIVGEGEIAVANSYDIHFYDCIGSSQMYILILGENAKNRLNNVRPGGFDNFLPVCDGTEEIFEFLTLFYNKIDIRFYNANDISDEFMCNGFIDIILSRMVKYYQPSVNKRKNNTDIVGILQYLSENFKNNITLDELSFKFGYTKSYLSTLFNKVIGMHITEYVNRLRLEHIEQVQKENDKIPITRVILDAGFGSLNSYYRALKVSINRNK